MSAETMKIPEPIMDPTTSETAASGLIPRMNSEEVPWADAGGASVGAAMEVPVVGGRPEKYYCEPGRVSPGGTAGGAADSTGSLGLVADSAALTASSTTA